MAMCCGSPGSPRSGSLRPGSVRFSVCLCSFRLRSVRSDSVRLGPTRPGSARPGSVGPLRSGATRFGLVRFVPVRFGSVRCCPVRSGSAAPQLQRQSHLFPAAFSRDLPVTIGSPEFGQHPLVPYGPVGCTSQFPKVGIDALVMPSAPECRGPHTLKPVPHMLKTMMLRPHG